MIPISRIAKLRGRVRLIGTILFCVVVAIVITLLFTTTNIPHETLLSAVIIGGVLTLISMIPSAKRDVQFIFPFTFILALVLAAIITMILKGVTR